MMHGILVFNSKGAYVTSMLVKDENEAKYLYETLKYSFKHSFLSNFTVELVLVPDGKVTVEELNNDGDIVKHIVNYTSNTVGWLK